MIVVTDAGPLRYLIEVGLIDRLAAHYGEVYVPAEVISELSQPETPAVVHNWLSRKVPWFHIVQVQQIRVLGPRLHPGEVAALSLASELSPDFLLLDDHAARKAAASYTTATVLGTLGVIFEISQTERHPAVKFREAIAALRKTTFYFSRDLERVIDQLASGLAQSG